MGRLATSTQGRTRRRLVSSATSAPTIPTDLANLWGWWDASDTATITGGSTVTQWNDKSGNARHITPGAAGSPSSGTRTLNSLNVVDFDGTNDGIGLTGSIGFGITSWTVFFVGGQDDTTGNAGLLSIYNNANHDYDTANAFVFNTSNHAGSKVIGVDCNVFVGGGGLQISGGTGATPTAVWVCRKNSGTVDIFKNSVSQGSGTASATGTANGGMSLCWRARESGNYLNGFCGEAVVYSAALSDTDLGLLSASLVTKWGQ